MEVSKYYILSRKNEREVILYSTLTTALITLSEEIYNKIFINKDFSQKDVIDQLLQMGFLTESHESQLDTLNAIYKRGMDDNTPVVKIFTTNKCNARCYYCFEKGIKFIDMTSETAEDTINFIKHFYPMKVLQINWFGGEPLMNFSIIEQITDALISDGYTLTTHMTTNGSLLCDEYINYLQTNYKKVSVQVTIDDIGEKYYHIKQYEDFSKEEAYDIVIKNIKLLLDRGVSTRIRVNFHKKQIDRGLYVFETLKKEFADYENLTIYLAPLTFDNEPKEDIAETEHTHLKLMKFYEKHNMVFDDKVQVKNELAAYSLKPKAIPCGSCRTKNLTITAEGHIYKCHRIAQYEYCKIGDVKTGLENNNKYLKMFITPQGVDKECLDCNVYPICRGGCTVLSMIKHDKIKTCNIYSKHSELVKLYYDNIMKQ